MSTPADTTHLTDHPFFDYYCDATGVPFCGRIHLMNLAIGNVDEEYCLSVLATTYDRSPEAMAAFCFDYVKARDCFKDPWMKFDASGCPLIEGGQCHCQKEAES
jgi:hypothetical protein